MFAVQGCVLLVVAVQHSWTAHVQLSNTDSIKNMLANSLNSTEALVKNDSPVKVNTGSSTTEEAPEVEEAAPEVEQPHKWFTQRLDHFTADNRTWRQRYWVRDERFRPGGPVFLSIGGEWQIHDYHANTSCLDWFTERHHALAFVLEHRFYGYSRPTSDVSVESLRYLTVGQALEDLAYFIQGMTRGYRLPAGTRWVALGCSYAGSLAAWLRGRHPELVFAAVASGAPLLAKVHFPEYIDSVRTTLSTERQGCTSAIREAYDELEKQLETTEGQAKLADDLGVCGIDLKNDNDMGNLHDTLVSIVTNAVQYNSWNTLRNETKVQTICRLMTDLHLGTPLDRYLHMLEEIVKVDPDCVFDNTTECSNYTYSALVEEARNVSWQSISAEDERRVMSVTAEEEEQNLCPEDEPEVDGDRPWLYQCCTEFGFFNPSEGRNSLTGVRMPRHFYTQQCADVFGEQFTEESIERGVARTNAAYQELALRASRVLFIYGSQDPWATLGVTENTPLGAESEVLVIPGASHCQEGNAYDESDPPALQIYRLQVRATVIKWLSQENAPSDQRSLNAPNSSAPTRPSYVFKITTRPPPVPAG